MTQRASNPAYTRYHPKWHRRRMPIFWWLGHGGYTRFITRELTSLAVAYVAFLLIIELWAIGRGAETFERLQGFLARPGVIMWHGFVLAALVFHTVTWLGLAPRALVIRIAGRRLPDAAVVAGHYLAWVVASAAIFWLLVGR